MASTAVDGSLNITVVSGTTYTGLIAADGSLNVVLAPAPATVPIGSQHPCGAFWVTVAPVGIVAVRAPDGSMYVSETPYTTGGQRVTVISGSLGGSILTTFDSTLIKFDNTTHTWDEAA